MKIPSYFVKILGGIDVGISQLLLHLSLNTYKNDTLFTNTLG